MLANDILTVGDGIYQIGLGGTSATLVETNEGPVLIDAGWRWSKARIQKNLRKLGYVIEDVALLAITHFHPDHSGSAKAIKSESNSPVAMHAEDALILSKEISMPGVVGTWYGKILFNPLLNFLRSPSVYPDLILENEMHLPVSTQIEVIHTPGHTAGSVCFHIPEKRLLVGGDVMKHRGGQLHPPSRFFSQDLSQAVHSLKRLRHKDCEAICLSHFPAVIENGNSLLDELLDRL
ncbi:MAG: MBL fold metallo-hydrolase [Chloroflexota bacterium]|nr:MBL fold metallo-hydrolase [Chloroflexota bacterium]